MNIINNNRETLMDKEMESKVLEALTAVRDEFVAKCNELKIVDTDGKAPGLHIYLKDGYVSFFSMIPNPEDEGRNIYALDCSAYEDGKEEE